MSFTPEQEAAIRARNRNILVAAAAGSGKTTVLVERIFTLVAEEQTDIDRLLVVTFTRAAAAQMRERIRKRIAEHLVHHPEDTHLRRQETLLHHAQIATIDSFCQYVVRENIAELDIDPAYRIADAGEMALLAQDAMDETLRSLYEEKDPSFLRLASWFGTRPSDAELEKHIRALSVRADSMPYPALWLDGLREAPASENAFEDSTHVAFCRADTAALLKTCVSRMQDALAVCEEADGPYPYAANLEEEAGMLQEAYRVVSDAPFDAMRAALLRIDFKRLSPVSAKDAVSDEKKELVKQIREDVKDTVLAIRKRYFRTDASEYARMEALQQDIIRALVDAVLRYRTVFYEKKKEQNLFDFSDVEHLALQLLTTPQKDADGVIRGMPTNLAREMGEYYREVMIDEYQDSNRIQDVIFEAIAGRSDGRCTRFMVGDVKQSIYRFRLACPELFMEKFRQYDADENAGERRILLHHNFRSRREIVDSVNALFSRLMWSDLGEIDYDGEARLVAGKEDDGKKSETEFWLCETASDRDAFEASFAARRIKKLVREEGFSFRDIVILLRAPAGRDETWRKVLEAEGIPVYVESRTGYFGAREVVVMLQMLSVLNNPLDDLKLAGVMHSPIGLFTEEETGRLRVLADAMDEHGYFYDALCAVTKQGLQDRQTPDADRTLLEKTDAFLRMLERFRERSERMPLRELITSVLDETGFANAVSALPDGEKRSANLQLLLSRASSFEQNGMRGLSRFVHFIESLQKASLDEGEANVLDENADVVRLMSIHKSKGLEFPVVFLAGCAKGFMRSDAQGDVLTDATHGIGMSFIDLEKRTKRSTLKKNVIARKAITEMLGEELRVLYVATTRAMEKLILCGTVKDAEAERAKADAMRENEERLSYAAKTSAGGYLQWILGALSLKRIQEYFLTDTVREEEERAEEAMEAIDAAGRFEKLLAEDTTPEREAAKAMLEERFQWKYRHEALKDLFAKTTVTELKAQLAEEEDRSFRPFSREEVSGYVPAFMRDDEAEKTSVSGAARGTLYHKAMELLFSRGFAKDALLQSVTAEETELRLFFEKMEQEGYFPKGESDALCLSDLTTFLATPLAARMEQAEKKNDLHTEQPFMMGVSANEVEASLPETEQLLIQGIIDCFFEEEDGITVLDYKTDRVETKEGFLHRYAAQLSYYARALHTITKKPVKECLIYSFHLSEIIPVPFTET